MKNKQDKIALDSLIARQIVKEIMDFGITQDQILRICKFLACELEDIGVMKDIVETVDRHVEESIVSDDNTVEKKDKLITEF